MICTSTPDSADAFSASEIVASRMKNGDWM
jgi:hypothetical protein